MVALSTKSTLKKEIVKRNPTFDATRISNVVNVAIVVGVVFGIIFLVLYVLLALQVRKGRNWARIVTLVLASLGVLGGLISFVQTVPALSHVAAVISAALDVAIIVFLAQGSSARFFSPTSN